MQRSMWVEACLEKEFKDKCVPEAGLAVSKSVCMCESTHFLAHVSVSVGMCVDLHLVCQVLGSCSSVCCLWAL